MSDTKDPSWVVFSYSLPQKKRASLRVTFWRRLRRIGALSPKLGVQLLPWNQETVEAFDWLAQEALHAGGDAMVMHVDRFEGLSFEELAEAFRAERRERYAEVEHDLSVLEKSAATKRRPAGAETQLRERTGRIRKRYEDIEKIDFFGTEEGRSIGSRLQRLDASLRGNSRASKVSAERANYVGRIWVTRPRPFVDRLACAWLIRRFIDSDARIRYSDTPKTGEIAFDMPNAQFGHVGDDCTFETMIKAFQLTEPVLSRIAEVVHAIDLSDDLFEPPEAPGVEAILRGWQRSPIAEEVLEERGLALFDGLYRSFAIIQHAE